LEYGVWAGLLLGLFLAYWSLVYLMRKDWARLPALWRGLAIVVGVWFVATSALLIPAFLSVRSGDYPLKGGDEYFSTDLAALVTRSPLWGAGTAPVGTPLGVLHVPAGTIENTVYLGIVPLVLAGLAALAIRRSPHRVVFWLVVFVFFTTLALGPYLYIGDTKTFSVVGASFSVPLPYQIYDQLPLVSVGRVPSRLIVFGLVVLAGTGFDVLTSWLKPKYKLLAPLAALLILGLVVLEYWNPPVSLYHPPEPAILKAIGDDPGDFAVLNVPWGRNSGGTWAGHASSAWLANYYQTLHGKATLGGTISRAKRSDLDWVWEQPGLRYLACAGCTKFFTDEDTNPDVVRQLFREYKIKYVVLRRGSSASETYDEYLRTTVGLTPVFTDATMPVYQNPGID
jgi:hypothetical protein